MLQFWLTGLRAVQANGRRLIEFPVSFSQNVQPYVGVGGCLNALVKIPFLVHGDMGLFTDTARKTEMYIFLNFRSLGIKVLRRHPPATCLSQSWAALYRSLRITVPAILVLSVRQMACTIKACYTPTYGDPALSARTDILSYDIAKFKILLVDYTVCPIKDSHSRSIILAADVAGVELWFNSQIIIQLCQNGLTDELDILEAVKFAKHLAHFPQKLFIAFCGINLISLTRIQFVSGKHISLSQPGSL